MSSPSNNTPPDVLNLDQAAAMLRVNERTVLSLIQDPSSGLRGFRAGRHWRINRAALFGFMGISASDPQDFKVLTLEEVAARLQVHRVSVVRWMADPTSSLKGFKVRQQWRFLDYKLNEYMGLAQVQTDERDSAHERENRPMAALSAGVCLEAHL